MKILFDMRSAQAAQNRGIGNYALHLISGLLTAYADIEIEYLVDPHLPALSGNVLPARMHFVDRLDYLDSQYDVFFVVGFSLVLESDNMEAYLLPSIIKQRSSILVGMVYDMTPLIFEDVYLKDEVTKKRYLSTLEIVKKFDHIFCISESAKNDLLKFSGIETERVSVVYGAGRAPTKKTKAPYNFDARYNNLVYIGGDTYIKNLDRAAEAFGIAYKSHNLPKDTLFFIICQIHEEAKKRILAKIEKYNIESHLILPGYVPDEIVDSLVQTSKATVFPSLYEGLGMPILESYALDTPVFAGNNSSLKEITTRECQFDSSNTQAIADAYSNALTNRDLCNRSLEFGKSIVGNFTWEKTAASIYLKIESLLNASKNINQFDKVGICTSLSPDENGVAISFARLFGRNSHEYCFFTASSQCIAMQFLLRINQERPISIFSISHAYSDKYLYLARAHIYIISNSKFSSSVLEESVKWKDLHIPRYAYFYDNNSIWALYYYLESDFSKMKALLIAVYPERHEQIASTTKIEDIIDSDIPCFAPILLLSGIQRVFITTESCKKKLMEDVRGRVDVISDVLPLPIEKIAVDAPVRCFDSETLIVGHFGYFPYYKKLDLLISAIHIVKRRRKCALILAGYGDLERAAEGSGLGSSVHIVRTALQSELYAVMASIDTAIQLQYTIRGEDSVVINELLGLGKRIITTRGFVDDDVRDLVVEVDPSISPEDLAELIMNTDTKSQSERARLALERRSMTKITNKLESMLIGGEDENSN